MLLRLVTTHAERMRMRSGDLGGCAFFWLSPDRLKMTANKTPRPKKPVGPPRVRRGNAEDAQKCARC